MKPKNKKEKIFHEKLEELDSITSPSTRKMVREAKRKLKKRASKNRRREEEKLVQQMGEE